MDAAPALSTLDSCYRIVLEVENCEIDVAVTQVIASRARTVDPGDLLHPEHVDVELGRLVDVLGREGDVLDLGHGRDASCAKGCLVACKGKVRQSRPEIQVFGRRPGVPARL